MRALVTLDNSAIDSMLGAEELLRYIPCLAQPPRHVSPRRGCCGGGPSSNVNYSAIKNCLAGLDSVNAQRIRDFFGTKNIRLYYSDKRENRSVTVKKTNWP